MEVDPLSGALTLVRARCRITGRLAAGGDWSVRFRPEFPLKLYGLVHGRCWLILDGEARQFHQGEVIVLNGVDSVVLCSDPAVRPIEAAVVYGEDPSSARIGDGDDFDLVGGHVEMNRSGDDLLLAALPRIAHIADTPEAGEMLGVLTGLLREAGDGRPGAHFAAAQHAQLLLVHVLRFLVEHDAARPGWLTALGDAALRPAVELMHGDPARSWGLDELARACGMSRSTFAARFRDVAGQPPVAYLNRWRIRLAEQALRDTDITVAALAARLGYATPSSFSHAFQRITGLSPGQHRRLEPIP
ncbi:AraC family transcriptional regulator [Kutzneria sp. CA-103260]|uniref:AraC family transcriptional regulator n=1 Tax=Kutzneria sp. CA-103260 TaxID=2802641 RepID=UPI001BA9CD1B|nr:AraC family transcriptional regulator [Kutzneria sp. CA-103260]